MRPGQIDRDEQLIAELVSRIQEADESGDPVQYVRDFKADRHLKEALMPDSKLSPSVICWHLKQAEEAGLFRKKTVGTVQSVIHGHTVKSDLTQLSPT